MDRVFATGFVKCCFGRVINTAGVTICNTKGKKKNLPCFSEMYMERHCANEETF